MRTKNTNTCSLHDSPSKSGFTLLELSIVLTVIGLLAGGIMVGRHLIRQSNLISTYSDVEKYVSATQLFSRKYLSLPGDIHNATEYWGADADCPNTTANTVPKEETCNGNGNGKLDLSVSYEWYRYWQHLSNAGLINGQFTGVAGDGNNTLVGLNVPVTKMGKKIGFTIYHVGYNTGTGGYFPGDYGHVAILGKETADGVTYGGAMTPEEAFLFDKKFDDGFIATGKIVSWPRDVTWTTCATTNNASTAAYDTANKAEVCSIAFTNLF